jgi:hypothetical protein
VGIYYGFQIQHRIAGQRYQGPRHPECRWCYTDSNPNSDGHTDTHGYANAEPDSNASTESFSVADSNSDTYAHSQPIAHCDSINWWKCLQRQMGSCC